MTQFGYTLFSELHGPRSLVARAMAAEEAGFDLAVMSDHFHPWLSSHTDSPFAWSVFGAVAERTERMELMSYVTCPFLRYHPAIIAQAAATIQLLSEGRFTLGLGAGERLNEHVVGRGWPSVDVRHEMLVESIEAIRSLFSGEMVTYRGTHITVEDARLFSLPQPPPRIAVAGSGSKSVRLAAEQGDAFIGVDPDAELVDEYRDLAGTREPSARWCCPTTPTKARRAITHCALHSAWPAGRSWRSCPTSQTLTPRCRPCGQRTWRNQPASALIPTTTYRRSWNTSQPDTTTSRWST